MRIAWRTSAGSRRAMVRKLTSAILSAWACQSDEGDLAEFERLIRHTLSVRSTTDSFLWASRMRTCYQHMP